VKRRGALALAAVSLVVALVAGTASPAGAGQWTEPTTWGSGTTIGTSATNYGNVVGVWQLFLSTRYRPTSGSPFTPSFTGVFTTTTSNYTKVWQLEHAAAGLSVDGIVGPNTWAAARFFHVGANPYQGGGWKYFQYVDLDGYPGSVPLPYTTVFGTWFFRACPAYASASGAKLIEWTDIDLPATC
jgi:hypothetical protein